jgi:hypothetical protein
MHRSVVATRCAGDALSFARTIGITLDLDLDLWYPGYQKRVNTT